MDKLLLDLAGPQGFFAVVSIMLFGILAKFVRDVMRSNDDTLDRVLKDKAEAMSEMKLLQEDSKQRERSLMIDSKAREEKLMKHHDETIEQLKHLTCSTLEVSDAMKSLENQISENEKQTSMKFNKVWEELKNK